MRILQLALGVGPTSAPYNELMLPLLGRHDITLCTFRSLDEPVDCRMEWVAGDNSVRGMLKNLWGLLRTQQYDVVHVHSPHLALMFLAIALLRCPALILRSVLHVHSSFSVYRLRNRWMLLPAFMLFGRVICCSHASLLSFPVVYRLLAGRRLTAIRNGVDIRRVDRVWQPRGIGTIDRQADLQLVSVGRLRRLKNHETVLQALAEASAKDVQLTIISDGPARKALETQCQQLGLADRVHLVGQLSREETLRRLWQADGFVSMSRGEGLPVAVLEAMSCHCPVILSDILPHREIRGQRLDLIPLFDPNDYQELAGAIDDWAGMPLDVLRAWGGDCRQHVEWDFGLDRMLDEYEMVLSEFDPAVTAEWGFFCRSVQSKNQRRRAA